jgi:hypothetical protein
MKTLVSTRTPEDRTIKYLRCIRRGSEKLLLSSSCLSVCQFARPHETVRSPADRFFLVFYVELYYQSVEQIQFELKSDKTMRRFTCHFVLLLEETPLGEIYPTNFRKTALSQAKGLCCLGWEWSKCQSCAGPKICVCVSFVRTVLKRQSCTIEIEHAAIFSSPLLHSRPCTQLHLQPSVSFGQHDIRNDYYHLCAVSLTNVMLKWGSLTPLYLRTNLSEENIQFCSMILSFW